MTFWTEIREGLGISWDAIRANKLRSALTTLGIIVGIVTVTLMGTAIEGLNRAFLQSISTMGADVLFVTRFPWINTSYEDWLRSANRREITYAQADAMARQLTLPKAIAPVAITDQAVRFENRNASRVTIVGTTEAFSITSAINTTHGRFLSSAEVEGGRPVAVIGSGVATNLFPNSSPLGNRIRVGNAILEVIGVMEKQGSFLGAFSLDNRIIIPLRTFMSEFQRRPYFEVQVKAASIAQLEDTKEEVRSILRKIRRVPPGTPDDFSINQQDMFIQTFNRIAGTIGTAGLFITGLSLFVGGIGIMNIMFVSVAERTREIGIRKAIGAKRRTILLQFLTEAALICLLAGVVAIAFAWAVTLAVSSIFPAAMSLTILGAALSVSILTGVVSGFLPAWRAARLDPVDALRSE